LLAYDATVVITSRAGQRRAPVADFLLGPRLVDLHTGEVVTAIELPVPEVPLRAQFARLTRRRGVDLATVSVCCVIDGPRTRVAFGAAGPRPFVICDDTGVLADPSSSEADRESILAEITAAASPITDVRAGAEYRRAMLTVLARRSLHDAHGAWGDGL
jgi:carbon-monoxide dehydrogenase medium subunit